MTEETKNNDHTSSDLWVPPKKIDQNTQRMAWLLFLEAWKMSFQSKNRLSSGWDAKKVYKMCLHDAQIVRELEQGQG